MTAPGRPFTGLSDEEARRRLQAEGPNELPSATKRHVLATALALLGEPMILLLIACGLIYLWLGDAQEACLLLGAIAVVVGIELYQERKTERALEALRDLSSPRALVIRGDRRIRIPGREVVRGDLVVLSEGDRVPADGLAREAEHLRVDESLLSGESVPVRKSAVEGERPLDPPGGEDLPSVFSGTLVVSGQGLAEVAATGHRTAMGRIGKSLQAITTEPTRVQRETGRLVRIFAVIGLSLCALVAVLYGLTRGNWQQGFLAGLTLAISLVPEELPVVLTIFLALGAWRISKQQVLTRRMPAVETLGAATVLCTDKTGTLTLNKMSVQELAADGAAWAPSDNHSPLPDPLQPLAAAAILASRREAFDPTEQALHQLAPRVAPERLRADWSLVREHPFSKAVMAVSYVWRSPDGRQQVMATKGAPEAVAKLCGLAGEQAARMQTAIAAMASKGLRVLGVAAAALDDRGARAEPGQAGLQWLGLVGLADPLRPEVPQAIRECAAAGITVMMITGDYPVTAQHIARQAGLSPAEAVIAGPELDRMDDDTLRRRIREVRVFARIVPEQKLRLVSACKANGDVVAMTGDGVNDAPALKAAHIGIAMGSRGTDVAREAADLVLLDDAFSSIVDAVRMGRRVFDNLKKAMAYIIAIHVPIAGLALIPIAMHWPLVLMPVHIVFLELIIDPACSIAFEAEPEEGDVMRRPPRSPHEPLFARRTVLLSLLQGGSVLMLTLWVVVYSLSRGDGDDMVRTLAFTTLIVGNLTLILTNRSWSRTMLQTLRAPNPAMAWIFGAALGVMALVLLAPGPRELFHLEVPSPGDLALCVVAGTAGLLWFELLKWRSIRRRRPV
jgi:Ca2+-transporting ATPase